MLEPEPRVMAVLEVVRLTAEGPPDMPGRPVDLVSKKALHRLLRDQVLSEARILYAA